MQYIFVSIRLNCRGFISVSMYIYLSMYLPITFYPSTYVYISISLPLPPPPLSPPLSLSLPPSLPLSLSLSLSHIYVSKIKSRPTSFIYLWCSLFSHLWPNIMPLNHATFVGFIETASYCLCLCLFCFGYSQFCFLCACSSIVEILRNFLSELLLSSFD